jgi:hypothetical protein
MIHMWTVFRFAGIYAHSSRCSGLCFLALALYRPLPPVARQFVADAAVAVVTVVT